METKQKSYTVIWHYMANYGQNEVKANNPKEALENFIFYGRKDIELFAFENNEKTSAHKPLVGE